MRNRRLLPPLFSVLLLATAPALAAESADRARDLSSKLGQIAAKNDATVSEFFAAASPFGFTEQATYQASFSPILPEPGASPVQGVMLPLALLLDVVLPGASSSVLGDLSKAQALTGSSALYFEDGPVFLDDLRGSLAPSDKSVGEDNSLTLSVPVVLSSGAAMVLRPGEEIVLDRAGGAFIVAAGGIVLDDASIRGSDETNTRVEAFRPFVLANAAGPVEISGARFVGLGFGKDPRTSGVSISGSNANAEYRAFVQDSRFTRTGTLSLIDAERVTVQRNIFSGSLATAISVGESAEVVLDGNVVVQSAAGHGIKVGPSARDVLVSDNIVAGNAKHGFLLEDSTGTAMVFNNLLIANQASGVAVLDATCLVVEQNITMANSADGIMVRRSAEVTVDANYIAENGRAGVSVASSAGVNILSDNNFTGNRVGLRAGDSYALQLSGNNWTGQAPRLLDGDAEHFSVQLLNGINAATPMIMSDMEAPAGRQDCNDKGQV